MAKCKTQSVLSSFRFVYNVLTKQWKQRGWGWRLTGLAVVNVGFAVASGEAWFAATAVTSQGVLAGCTIATGILHTLFDVHLTCLALEEGVEWKMEVNFCSSFNGGT